jgi:hypothetical protein
MGQDRRRCFRIRLTPQNQRAVLKVDNQTEFPARLTEESSGGFALVTFRNIPLKLGQRAFLFTRSGWHEVELVHKEEDENETRMGFKRLCDLAPAPKFWARWWESFVLPYVGGSGPKDNVSVTALAMVVLLGLALLGIGTAWKFATRYDWKKDALGLVTAKSPPPPSSLGDNAAAEGRSRHLQVASELSRLQWLVGPDAARTLHLTRDQEDKIGRIVAQASREVSRLNALSPGRQSSDYDQALAVVATARARVRSTLTVAQIVRWESH